MATVGSTSFEISGPPADSSRFVRVEDVLRTHNGQGIRLNARHIIGLIICVLVLSFMIYIVVVNVVLDPGNIDIKNPDIQGMYVKYIFNNESISLEANASIRVSFKRKPALDSGSSNLTARTIDDTPIVSASSSKVEISGGKEQLVVVKFEAYQIHLPKEKIRDFQRKLEERKIELIVDVDFKWHIKHKKFLVLPYLRRHATFSCDIPYRALPIDVNHSIKCNV